MRWTGQIFWLLAYNACAASHLLLAFTPEMVSGIGPMGSRIQLQQRNCSRFSRDFLRRSTFPSSQRTETRTSGLRFEGQDYLIPCPAPGVPLGGGRPANFSMTKITTASRPEFIITGGAGFIGSNLTL